MGRRARSVVFALWGLFSFLFVWTLLAGFSLPSPPFFFVGSVPFRRTSEPPAGPPIRIAFFPLAIFFLTAETTAARHFFVAACRPNESTAAAACSRDQRTDQKRRLRLFGLTANEIEGKRERKDAGCVAFQRAVKKVRMSPTIFCRPGDGDRQRGAGGIAHRRERGNGRPVVGLPRISNHHHPTNIDDICYPERRHGGDIVPRRRLRSILCFSASSVRPTRARNPVRDAVARPRSSFFVGLLLHAGLRLFAIHFSNFFAPRSDGRVCAWSSP
ncbi:hypothetical protein [Pandoravirus japonicus]|uniref:Uncharacterized protein n=1 Tax=Pandoravirus japonicus TaxID=2823154 RepID=A0A811BPN2_9VIRU|nr:hypothetical protein [Pandoravirus japonicus]